MFKHILSTYYVIIWCCNCHHVFFPSYLYSCFPLCLQQKHRDLSGQAEQLHSVCQSHKDKIKGLFQTKLDEVGTAILLPPYHSCKDKISSISRNVLILTSRHVHQFFTPVSSLNYAYELVLLRKTWIPVHLYLCTRVMSGYGDHTLKHCCSVTTLATWGQQR